MAAFCSTLGATVANRQTRISRQQLLADARTREEARHVDVKRRMGRENKVFVDD